MRRWPHYLAAIAAGVFVFAIPPRAAGAPVNAAPQAPLSPDVDLTGFWYHIRHGKLDAARSELLRLQDENPYWKPPADAMQTLRRLTLKQDIIDGKKVSSQDLSDFVGGFVPCDDPETAWFLTQHRLTGPDMLRSMIIACKDAGVSAGSLSRYLALLPEAERQPAMVRLRGAAAGAPDVLKIIDDADFANRTKAIAELSRDRGDKLDAGRIEDYQQAVRARHSADGAEILGWLFLTHKDPDQSIGWFGQAKNWGDASTANEGLALALAQKSADAAAAGDMGTALQAAHASADAGNRAALETLGWLLLNNKQTDKALLAFNEAPSNENVIYGQILSVRGNGDMETAEQMACASSGLSARLKQTCDDVRADRLLAAYHTSDYGLVLELAGKIGVMSGQRPDLMPVVAWSYLRHGDAATAADLFENLYRTQPDPAYATGLLESLEAVGDHARLASLRSTNSYISKIFTEREYQAAVARKQFDLASRLNPDSDILRGRGAWAFSTGMESRSVEGKKGLGQIMMTSPHIGGQGMIGDVRVDASLASLRLDAGTAGKFEDLGSRPAPDRRAPLARQDVVIPKIIARLERRNMNLSGTISTTPLGGVISALPVGALDATFYGDPFILSGGLFSRPVTSSMLSFAGTRDPVTGLAWGRVVETGTDVQIIWAPTGIWSAAVQSELAMQHGRNVQDNASISIRGDLARNFAPEGMDYLRAGPFVSWAGHDRNLGHYTYGQGGYYSPQSDMHGGLLLDGLSPEGRQWQMRATASVSYAYAEEDYSPRFPLTNPEAGNFNRTVSSGISGDLTLRGAVMITPHLILGSFANASAASSYGARMLGLTLEIPLQPRSALVSTDLPESGLGFRR